jgi:hypothetical protein
MYTIYADVATYQWKVHNGLMVFTKQPSTREVMTEEMIVPKKNEKKSNMDIMLLVPFMPILYLW